MHICRPPGAGHSFLRTYPLVPSATYLCLHPIQHWEGLPVTRKLSDLVRAVSSGVHTHRRAKRSTYILKPSRIVLSNMLPCVGCCARSSKLLPWPCLCVRRVTWPCLCVRRVTQCSCPYAQCSWVCIVALACVWHTCIRVHAFCVFVLTCFVHLCPDKFSWVAT